MNNPHVVIVGGGFGGLDAARSLAGAPVSVTLVDRHNYHLFQPLLYQVATAALSPGDIASPIRWILRGQKNVTVLLASVRGIDVAGRRVLGNAATIGRGAAVVEIRGVKVSGTVAWLFWLFLHLFWLIGFRNRLVVLGEWAWSYFTLQRRVRLITGTKS